MIVADLAMERVVGHHASPFVETAELLDGIDPVHRPLERQVYVEPVEEIGEHGDDRVALEARQRFDRRGGGERLLPAQAAQLFVHGSTASGANSSSRLSSR